MSSTAPSRWTGESMHRHTRRRYAAERRFQALGFAAVAVSVLFLVFLLYSMAEKGLSGFVHYEAALPIDFVKSDLFLDPSTLRGPDAEHAVLSSDLGGAISRSATVAYGRGAANLFGDSSIRVLATDIVARPDMLSSKETVWLPVGSNIDIAAKGEGDSASEQMVAQLKAKGALRSAFNANFFEASDATDPSAAGVWGALKGSFLTILVTMALAFPIGVLSAIYLEEFAPRNRWTDAIEVSINNLAAVPSIIFGLLGLAVFLNVMNLPRSAPLVGGMTLALMTMPVIVIAGRNAIKAVPPSIRDAALGVGASRLQVTFHHVLPLALPGILTGTIIGLARALGETAPLLMIGMRAFIATPPGGITDPATVLPVQIFLWSDEVDRGFVEKTSAAIIVLLLFMLLMNGLAIYLRNRFERRW
jgi:phosphate transport system permease protein